MLAQNVLLLQREMEKDVEEIKDTLKKDLEKEKRKHRNEMRNMKVRFPTHTKCVPIYIHSTQCCSHVLRLLTQFHITITYFLHFRSNHFNYFVVKPKKILVN